MEPELVELLNNSFSVERISDTPSFIGSDTPYGTTQTYSCRLEPTSKQTRQEDGTWAVATGKIITEPHQLKPADRYTVNGAVIDVIGIDTLYDEAGLEHHQVVYYG